MMLPSPELVQVVMAERLRDADRMHLETLARRIAACCAPDAIRSRIAQAIARAGDVCCPTDAERIARARGILGA